MMLMGNLLGTYKTYLFIGLGVVLALVAAWWSLSGETQPNSALVASQSGSGVVPGERGIVDTLLQLRSVSLSGTIFSDPAFARLQDFGTQIIPEPVGRPNPFAPLTARSTSTAGTTGQLFAPQRR